MVYPFTFTYNNNTFYFVWDIESGSLLSLERSAFLVVKNKFCTLSNDETAEFESINPLTLNQINDEILEIEFRGLINKPKTIQDFKKPINDVKAICLHICHDCNLACDYCFASEGTYNTEKQYMSLEVGKSAIDFLLLNSGKKQNVEVDFFGGEPLLNFEVVKNIVSYGKNEAKKYNKTIFFTLTTNCLLLDDKTSRYLNEEMDNIVLSIDGRKKTHDETRHSKTGWGSFDTVLKNAQKFLTLRNNKKHYVRGTFTSKNLDFLNDVKFLVDQGFKQISLEPVVLPENHKLAIKKQYLPQILEEYERLAIYYLDKRKVNFFNFFHFMIDLKHGPCINKCLTGCGAAVDYVAVSPHGEIYPCHQYVGIKKYLLGNVFDGFHKQANKIRNIFANNTVLDKEECNACIAKYYCGGGCSANAFQYNNDISKPLDITCALTKKRMELSLAIYYIERLHEK